MIACLGFDMTTLDLDQDGHLVSVNDWTPAVAQKLADTLAIQLTPLHYDILLSVRTFFAQFNHPPTTRVLVKYLATQLPEHQLDNQALQVLFATGLVARHVNRIAGLPKPANCL